MNIQQKSEARRKLKAQRKSMGLCTKCGEKNDAAPFVTCNRCNKESVDRLIRLRKEGICTRCKRRKAKEGNYQCEQCLKIERERCTGNPLRHAQYKAWRQQVKAEVITHYGGECTCCGESDLNCLTMDHIGGDGHKMSYKDRMRLHKWLKDNDFPKGFQVLCWSCNGAKGTGKMCPAHEEHQKIKQFRKTLK